MDPQELTEAQVAYKTAVEEAEKAKKYRDEKFRQAKAEGATQTDIVKATGLTRETVRRVLNPDAAEAVREARKRSAKEKRA